MFSVSSLLDPTPSTILLTTLLVLSIPILLHFLIYRSSSSSARSALPAFLLLGPSGAGKTSLLTLFEAGHPSPTRPSQTPLTVQISLPSSHPPKSSAHRSPNDPSLKTQLQFLLIDTPGHGKLRHDALSFLPHQPSSSAVGTEQLNLRGVIFVLDAADLAPGSEALRAAAEYLYEVLGILVKGGVKGKGRKGGWKVLVAANKGDLFTALPAGLVRRGLEGEIEGLRGGKGRGLLDSGVGGGGGGGSSGWLGGGGGGDADEDDDNGWLGDGGESKFRFEQLEADGVEVEVLGGSVLGSEGEKGVGGDVKGWWEWIAGLL